MSKKIIYIRIIIVAICLLFISIFVFLIKGIQESININDVVIEETKEEKMVFDLTIPPKDQRKIISEHRIEYLKQLYMSIFNDEKLVNCTPILSYGSLVDDFKSMHTLIEFLKPLPYWNLFDILFEFNDVNLIKRYFLDYPLNMDDLPVTENYKEKHPKPLYEEFDFIKKENYDTQKKYSSNLQTDIWLSLYYNYGIGVDETEQVVNVVETKHVSFVIDEEGEEVSRVVYDENHNEMTEDTIDTRKFVFKYTLDEKGYVDDIEFVEEIKLADDKYLDKLWGNLKG